MTIYKPDTNHAGDTFREMLDLWEEAGLCELRISPDNFVWVNEPGDILLYDHDRLDDKHIPKFNVGLFANTVPDITNCYPWTFWGRSPRLLKDIHPIATYKDRSIESIFLGKIENNIQYTNRTKHDWSKSIQIFEMPINGEYKHTKQEYLSLLLNSKFGLCLPGYGPKCNREIELLACGTVPIITPGVDLTYHNEWIEDVHYIKVNTPEEIEEKTNISEGKWSMMATNCRTWFEKNASLNGSFELTRAIISEL